MATTAEGRQITEAHRLAQIELGEATQRDLRTVWRNYLSPRRIEATFRDYFEVAFAVLDQASVQSEGLSAAYVEAFHSAEAGRSQPLDLRRAERLSREQAMASLFWTGPAEYRRRVARGEPARKAEDGALAKTLGAGKRLTLQGGREVVATTARSTGAIRGLARVTDKDPCSFCAMLASRGPVYKRDSFSRSDRRFSGFGNAKVHDDCACQMEPVYRGDYSSPGRADEFAGMWSNLPPGLSPADQRRAFRGLYERGAVPTKYLPG